MGHCDDVLDLQGHAGRTAVSTAPAPLCQQVLADLVAGERALLILHPRDFRVLHLLGIELDQFQADRLDRGQPAQAGDPGLHVGDPACQAGRQPTRRSMTILEAGGPVAGFAGAPRASQASSPIQGRFDQGTPMVQFGSPHNGAGRIVHQRQAGCPTAGVELQPERHQGRVRNGVLENNAERVTALDGRFAGGQQPPRPAGMHRVERLVG
jgi:hypothetical protein